MQYTVEITTELTDIPDELWTNADSPFTSKAYWQALADNQLIGDGSDWQSFYFLVFADGNISPLAMMPVFLKNHHAGEYVFDHAWAQAYYQYGRNYYPRLVTSVPFTPVTGKRIWFNQDIDTATTSEKTIIKTLNEAVNLFADKVQASSWHLLFVSDVKSKQWQNIHTHHHPIISREGCHFLWHNRSLEGEVFNQFADYLNKLTAKKRKNIKQERKKISQQNITCTWKLGTKHDLTNNADISVQSDLLDEKDWQIFYQCYAMTYLVRGQKPYLSIDFFMQISQTLANNIAMAIATNEFGEAIAASLFFYDDDTLYGRYWGCLQQVNYLHFELCYYQGISFAIAMGLEKFDPGTQGEHKLIRGFEPTKTHSLHKVFDADFLAPIQDYCLQDRQVNNDYMQECQQSLPFKNQQ